jgi:kynurenine formamidase
MRIAKYSFVTAILAAVAVVYAASAVAQKHGAAGAKGAASGGNWIEGVSTGRNLVIDMTYPVSDKFPAWPGDDRVFEAKANATVAKDGYFTRSFWMLEHYGTHMDAPAHFPPGKITLDELPEKNFFGPAVVIDVREEVAKDADYRLTVVRVKKWEAEHGKIPKGAIAVLRTGWGSRVPDATRYRNMDSNKVMHFPGYSVESAKLLIERGVVGLGIDTLSIDYGGSKDYDVHHVDLAAGLYNLENLAHTEYLPESGAFIIAAPIKLEGGSGGPCRVFAVLPPK